MYPNSLIQLPNYVHFQVIENNTFVFINKTSETLCFGYDVLWLLDTLQNNSNSMLFTKLLTSAQDDFSDETSSDIEESLIAQIQELLQLNVLVISH